MSEESFGIESAWKGKYSSLGNYYKYEYKSKYYELTADELTIDPDETIDQIENYDWEQQKLELTRCSNNFGYFCHKYVKIGHPIKGLIPFVLFKYQHRVIDCIENRRFNIVSKFRQGGLSTLAVIWSLWRGLFKFNETIMLLSKADREAMGVGEIAVRAMRFLPSWMQPEMTASNKHEQSFAETGTSLHFLTPVAARSKSITWLIIDEGAFIPNMDQNWKAMYPVLSTGGSCVCISTVNGLGNWYEETYHKAMEGSSPFHVIELDYTEHPDYDNEKWVQETRANLGEKGWRQEVLRDFIGSGSTYIPPDTIRDLAKKVREKTTIRRRFPEYNNHDRSLANATWEDKGALWIFKEKVDGREYIMGVDGAEGIGEDGDNSCIEVIDSQTCEQVAEFYSNSCPTDKFAKIIEQIAMYYNHALVVVETSGGAGVAIIAKLQEYYYDNLYYDVVSKNVERPGVKMTKTNRVAILEALQNRLLNESLPIASTRFMRELDTFIWNKEKQRAEPQKNKHDDALFAMAHAVYVRDQNSRQPTFFPTDALPEITDAFRLEMYEKIRQEIYHGAPEEWIDPVDRDMPSANDDEDVFAEYYSRKRPYDKILREFAM